MWRDSINFSSPRHRIIPTGFWQEGQTLLSFWQQLGDAMCPFTHWPPHHPSKAKVSTTTRRRYLYFPVYEVRFSLDYEYIVRAHASFSTSFWLLPQSFLHIY
jgi:hypothetical protein